MHSAIKLDVTQPCTQSWEQMTPSAAGNYCRSCQKTVVDFSVMSDQDIFQYMQQATSSVCGRFTNDQLNRVLRPAVAGPSVAYRKNFWQLLIAGSLFAQQAKSQVKPVEPAPISQNVATHDSLSLGENMYQVIDGTDKQPLSGASIFIDNADATTDDHGIFRITALQQKITISYVGYKTREFLLTTEPLPKIITLERDTDLLDQVSITAPTHGSCFTGVLGGVASVRIITPFQNFVRHVNQWIPDPAVKVFPNPVSKGQSLNVQFSLPKPGKYALKIFAADGRLVHTQALQITSNKQPFQLPTSFGYASGVYWIHVECVSEKRKAHEVKFVVR